MNFDELQKHWRDEISQPLGMDQQMQALRSVQQRCTRLERNVWIRDLVEIIAAVGLITGFIIMRSRFITSWLSVIGSVGMCAWALGVIVILVRTRHTRPLRMDASASEFVRQKLEWHDNQQRLLNSVQRWYVAPCLLSGLLIVWGSVRPGKEINAIVVTLVMVAVGVWIIRLNHRTAAARFQPVVEDLLRLRDSL